MPGIIRELDVVSGLTVITVHPLDNPQIAHLGGVYFVRAEDVVGRWNVVLEYELNGQVIEVARVVGIQSPGLYAFTLTPPLDRPPAPLIEANKVRYFTISPNPRFSGSVHLIAVV